MIETAIERFTLADATHGEVRCVELRLAAGDAPIVIFLYGGGGSAETLLELRPILEPARARGALGPVRVVSADVGPLSFYLDDPTRGTQWESVVAERLVEHLAPTRPVGLVGISMGGYGALKIALARPQRFRAVAAVAPMIEPALAADGTPLRNRYAYPPDVPQALLGTARDAALYASDHPIHRARRNVDAIRAHDLAILVDAGSRDALHAHDGAELFHRALWDLDVAHEYHLHRDADHVGATIPARLERAFAWVLDRLAEGAAEPDPTARGLRAMLEPARREAALRDPTFERTYGLLP